MTEPDDANEPAGPAPPEPESDVELWSEPEPEGAVVGAADVEGPADTAEEVTAETTEAEGTFTDAALELGGDVVAWFKENSAAICLSLTLAGIAIFSITFGSLALEHHRNYGELAYDAAIYDQAIWLVSRGGQTFMTERGMDVWGHHVNLVFYLFAPFYRLGAGPEFLYIVQNTTIALAALPVYLIVKDKFQRPSVGLVFAIAYLMYAPIQWISWINFHPEAMCIAPFMFAWYFATKKRWRPFFISVFCVLIMREDAALAVIMLGLVLLVVNRHSITRRHDARIALATFAIGVVWYALATQVVIPHFNHGGSAFYLQYFFSEWGGSISGIAENVIRHPDRVINMAMQPDRKKFYYQLGLPLGGFAILSPLHLLMAAPQMLASVIGGQPYARQIMYQYPSIMIAPIVIASIEGAHRLWERFRFMKWGLYVWLLAAAYISNVAWSNSPIGTGYGYWLRDEEGIRTEALDGAVAIIPDDAVVSASWTIGSHLSHREGLYDWPNPFWPAYWGNDIPGAPDCNRFPSASEVDYLALDMNVYVAGDINVAYIDALIAEEQFEVVYDEGNVRVLRRISPGPNGVDIPVNCPVVPGEGHLSALALIGADPPVPTTQPTTPTIPPVTAPPPTTEPSTTKPAESTEPETTGLETTQP